MLVRLFIQNYAIIDELEIEFSNKLNTITGETGAGKSIIVGALGLILGERADSGVLVNKEKKCVVEGVFRASNKKAVRDFLQQHDPDNYREDSNDELVLRREIAVTGKSRAFINDTPVTLAQLQQLSVLLVDLHQQFDTLELTAGDFQREVLDALAGHGSLLEEYQTIFYHLQQLKRETEDLKARKQQFDKEADYHRFQYKELENAGFKENELEEIDAELKLLSNAEGIKAALSKVYYELKENETPVVQQLKAMLNQLSNYSSLHSGLPVLIERLQSVQIELQDIAGEISHISDSVNYDPKRIEQLNERLSLGYKLQKKHGVKSTAELLDVQKQLEEKLQAVLNIDEAILRKEKDLTKAHHEASQLAEKISANRSRLIKPLEEKVNKLLAQVGMPNARLKVEVKAEKELNSCGRDSIEFLFNANIPSSSKIAEDEVKQFAPVRKVASGGELSRLMLCIKSLVAQSVDLPTMIFDEIDTGISGEAARQTGSIMKGLAAERQVICITHQPQIAGKADAHFFVYKEIVKPARSSDGEKIKTSIRRLTTEERITAIAKMLSGEKPTAAAVENAREIIMN
ncbi:MAG: DNA repair protein RecN [Bacteroidetes bacterium]|nr:DNA repair protein RecN [Bacteroidota bacterium]